MKVVIINKSDSIGGAAIVSRRLMEALRREGVDAGMLVVDRQTDSPCVHLASNLAAIRVPFLAERLKIFMANGFNRRDLFKVDTASDGLPLDRHPLVREADVICLNWVNQGMLSLRGLKRLLDLGKPVVWTMHDMWNMTGICHHAGECERWQSHCGNCPLLGARASKGDLSARVHRRKANIYQRDLMGEGRLHFVPVSNWLAEHARRSSLLAGMPISVIANAFPVPNGMPEHVGGGDKFNIVMGAARLDDPVKGLPILVEATRILAARYPEEASGMCLTTFGTLRDPEALAGVAIEHRHLGRISGEENVRDVYCHGDAVVSTSLYETLPGTLVEGQVYGCVPVSFRRGGQPDIVDHLATGYLAEWDDDIVTAAGNIAAGMVAARRMAGEETRRRMYQSAARRFAAPVIARKYIDLFEQLLREPKR